MQPLDERGLPQGYPFNADWEITPREFRARRDAGEAIVLVDCRTDAERDIARIEGTVHVPLHDFARHAQALRGREDAPIVVHCHHGARSLQATAALRQAGFDDVRSLAGGIHLWSMDIDPSVPVY
jgi:rhodanese-related sulfurtransferase